jgi:hypothetical protein
MKKKRAQPFPASGQMVRGKRHSTRSRLPSAGRRPGRRGRPSVYCRDLADKICMTLALGSSLRAICRSPDMPDVMTVIGWAKDPQHEFYLQYKQARIIQAELKVDELDDLAKSALRQMKHAPSGDCVDPAAVAAIKLLIDTRKWAASKVFPKVYGDRLDVAQEQKFIPLSELAERIQNEPDDE